eukprot:3495951-Pleurochrysis_carterae.AAC.1
MAAADRAKIDDHRNNSSWTMIDRSQVPTGRSIVRLIWVYYYKRKRSGASKALLCVQGCAKVQGVDYDQTFRATIRSTSLRIRWPRYSRECRDAHEALLGFCGRLLARQALGRQNILLSRIADGRPARG